jgi:Dynamin family
MFLQRYAPQVNIALEQPYFLPTHPSTQPDDSASDDYSNLNSMESSHFNDKLLEYSTWRQRMMVSVEDYRAWRQKYELETQTTAESLAHLLQVLSDDRINLAFVAEFSRGKTELINALFFAQTGVRLLPSSPGRTTMCPTELFYDPGEGSYIRLLDIESRYENTPFFELKKDTQRWKHIDLDQNDPKQMQAAFQELVAVKNVPKDKAVDLGLFNEQEAAEQGIKNPESVEIPCWRHALISFPHPLLQAGLGILDTPGLNALGSEPELTLSLLPSAQAVVFVVAADTGVTKSDLTMWNQHVSRVTNAQKGLAVVMNKIDSMWDDLSGDAGYEQSIKTQVKATATTLAVAEKNIFPISAKQALIAKIKNDGELLERSKIGALEDYLSGDIIQHRQKIMLGVVLRDMGFLINESMTLIDIKFANDTNQLSEFCLIDVDNRDKLVEMTETAKAQQVAYFDNMEHFKVISGEFRKKFGILIEALSPARFDAILKINRIEISNSITTHSMRQGIKKLFSDLNDLLHDCLLISNELQKFILRIHGEFNTSYGFKEISPQLFDITEFMEELEELFKNGEEFRLSTKTALTEKSLVVQKLYNTLVFQARNTLFRARREALVWGENVLSPVKNQILDHKKQIENRLAVLMAANESEKKLKENITRLESDLALLTQQREELMGLIEKMERVNGIPKDKLVQPQKTAVN